MRNSQGSHYGIVTILCTTYIIFDTNIPHGILVVWDEFFGGYFMKLGMCTFVVIVLMYGTIKTMDKKIEKINEGGLKYDPINSAFTPYMSKNSNTENVIKYSNEKQTEALKNITNLINEARNINDCIEINNRLSFIEELLKNSLNNDDIKLSSYAELIYQTLENIKIQKKILNVRLLKLTV